MFDTRQRKRLIGWLQSLSVTPGGFPPGVLNNGDTFGPRARRELVAQFGKEPAVAAVDLLTSYGAEVAPTKKWREAVAELRATQPDATRMYRLLLELLLEHADNSDEQRGADATWTAWRFLQTDNAQVLRGAVWAVADVDESWVTPLLGDVAVHCGVGFGDAGGESRCSPITTSAVAALAERGSFGALEVVAQLTRVKSKVQNKTIRKAIDKATATAAAEAGLTPGALVEWSVPDFGFDADGRAERTIGDHVALLSLGVAKAGATLAMRWRTPSGDIVGSVPEAVKEHHASELAELRDLAKRVKPVAAAQRARLEDLMACDREWSAADWIACYVGHPVVGRYANSLIWQTGDSAGLPVLTEQGWALYGHEGDEVRVAESDRLRLWHPIRASLAEIEAWRAHITDAQLRQPFKQAFREVYLLTPAEEETKQHSNRFAAHILRYRQAGALMRTLGWAANHLGYWEGGAEGEAVKEIGEDGWRAKFSFDLVEQKGEYDAELCSTGQVRFERRTGDGTDALWERAPLADVPDLVLSEAMRDVDLFVGVTSIANEVTWTDADDDRHRDYWRDASFGELTESSLMRREVLERLLPRTKIADRVELSDRYLIVHGRLRDYRIHLGSTNIMMSPADTYLCIVPKRGRGVTEKVFLPFEEDGGKLSLLLSKAFLLSVDTAITDPEIVRQLRHGL